MIRLQRDKLLVRDTPGMSLSIGKEHFLLRQGKYREDFLEKV
jgi:hypothetical protein